MRARCLLLVGCAVLLTACQERGVAPCAQDVVVRFGGVPDGDIGPLKIYGVDFQVVSGSVQGYRESGAATLLLFDAVLAVTPPCAATELELVIDRTQANLRLDAFATLDGSSTPLLSDDSQGAAGLEPEVAPFERWTLPLPAGRPARLIHLSTAGQTGVSVLVKEIVFR
jgi:hypothetical protein